MPRQGAQEGNFCRVGATGDICAVQCGRIRGRADAMPDSSATVQQWLVVAQQPMQRAHPGSHSMSDQGHLSDAMPDPGATVQQWLVVEQQPVQRAHPGSHSMSDQGHLSDAVPDPGTTVQ